MKAIRKGTAKVLLLAADAGAATAKNTMTNATITGFPLLSLPVKKNWGRLSERLREQL